MSEKIRLLVCLDCKTIEELPDYPQNARPELDFLLTSLVERHKGPTQFNRNIPPGQEHLGNLIRDIKKELWESPSFKEQLTTQIKDALKTGDAGMPSEWYATKSTFVEDAGRCFKEHGNPTACMDYRSDSKLLSPGTKRERKKLGLPVEVDPRLDVYLCDFCVYHQRVLDVKNKNRSALNS